MNHKYHLISLLHNTCLIFNFLWSGLSFIATKELYLFNVFSFILPLTLGIQIVTFVGLYMLQSTSINFTLSWMTIFLCAPFINALFGWNFYTQDGVLPTKTVSILSYNVSVFNVYEYLHEDLEACEEMIQWVQNEDSDVHCLQEFYNRNDTSFNEGNPQGMFQTERRLAIEQRKFIYAPPSFTNHIQAKFGLAIISRYPIIDSGSFDLNRQQHGSTNNVIYADILISPEDTMRIYNIHLQSLALDNGEKKKGGILNKLKVYSNKLIHALKKHDQQTDQLIQHIKHSPYPYIIAGDINELPFGYTYLSLRNLAYNAFEQKGKGFGFTHQKITGIRIDHIFHDKAFKTIQFRTLDTVNFTDHTPIKAILKY